MLEFSTVRIDDIDWYNSILSLVNEREEQITLSAPFGVNYIWAHYYGTKLCRFGDFILRGYFKNNGSVSFAFPLGVGDVKEPLLALKDYAEENGFPLCFVGLNCEQAEYINSLIGGFTFEQKRDNAEYIYEAEKLATLAGRKLHSKRNHLNRFEAGYNYTFEPIDSTNKADALAVALRWYESADVSDSAIAERRAIELALDDFDRLNFKGAIIRIDGKPVAMTMGEQISRRAFVTHFEKALDGYEGLYVAVNCYFAKILTDYELINREEDMGIEGLRRAKLSYKPAILLEQWEGVRNG
ncbi:MULTISPECIES: DUF2156 domain-containing protein [unclassified Ruminococcus]|uniref:DUF2156 domain-containing protein n=1 Tax=unclassified Ruminococcus TaxID=2608920 RepID=UPI00210EB2B9|nr:MULTISPECIES: phosphatidylglycerol lysyltransferase domain-containing protein [unclassified Ruminococcus]MCQ4023195.1 DUF2156 domain-containing protein [Ruminococcus sp. zg-924]MCQ4115413.1 DUF2156 domain-containing protein [Ruminococcus sp. zg-921]